MDTSNLSTNDQNVLTEEEIAKVNFERRLCKQFNNKAKLAKVLKCVGLTDHKIKMHIRLANSSKERYTLELVTKKKYSSEWLSEIVLDFRFGPPTWEQFIDVTYGKAAQVYTWAALLF